MQGRDTIAGKEQADLPAGEEAGQADEPRETDASGKKKKSKKVKKDKDEGPEKIAKKGKVGRVSRTSSDETDASTQPLVGIGSPVIPEVNSPDIHEQPEELIGR